MQVEGHCDANTRLRMCFIYRDSIFCNARSIENDIGVHNESPKLTLANKSIYYWLAHHQLAHKLIKYQVEITFSVVTGNLDQQ